MRRILSSRKHHYAAKVCILLIMVALIAGMLSCGGTTTPTRYNLTMAVAPPGNGTATDLTNASPYTAGTGVSIRAVANPGYRIVSWTAVAGTFANPNLATTTFTMPTQAVTVTAIFVVAYTLTMAANPVGGGTATDLTNASPYAAGPGVSIRAVANPGYRFVNWSAPAGTFGGNATASVTTFTMPYQNVTVTANFVEKEPPVYGFMDYLDIAQANWNSSFGDYAQMTGWTYVGQIADASERESIVAALSDPDQTWIAQMDPLDPTEVAVVRLSDALVGEPPGTLTEWEIVVDNSVDVGDHVVQVDWLVPGEGAVQTTTIASDDEIKFDPIFVTIVMVSKSIIESSVEGTITIMWIWGGTRGEITYMVEAICDEEHHLIACSHQCDAWMTLGDAQIQCMVEEIGDCCKLNYGYAWRTPTGSITIGWDAGKGKFEVTVTGLGSSGQGSGSVLDCC